MLDLYFLAGIFILIFLMVYFVHGEYALIGFVILTFLVIPSNLSATLRTVIQIMDFAILFYLFLKRYGLNFREYPHVPGYAILFLIILYSSLFLTIIFSRYPSAGLLFVVRSSIFFIIMYFFYGIIRTENHVRIVIFSVFLSGFILVSAIIVDFILMGRGLAYLFQPMRELQYGIYGNYNVSGSYGIIVFPIAISALYIKRLRKYRPLIWCAIIILLGGVLLLASRAALAGIILGTAIILFFNNKKAFKVLLQGVAVILIIYFLMNPFGQSLDYALRLENGLSGHDEYWKLALNIFSSHPVFGIGPGSYPLQEFNYLPVMLDSYIGQRMISLHELTASSGINNSHSFYLMMMSDMGVFGLLTLSSLLIIFYRSVFSVYNKYKDLGSEIKVIIQFIIAVGICLTFRGFVESGGIFYYGSIATDLPFWLFFVIVISYDQNRIKPEIKKN